MHVLIDADIVLHRVGYTTENDEEWIAKARTNEMLDGILTDTDAKNFELFLSDTREANFRTALYPDYKANRLGIPRPRHYDYIKTHLIQKWGARIAHEMEADDALGIGLTVDPDNRVIASIDKDLLQVAGNHYNFVKKKFTTVSSWQGLQFFYSQILIGDVVDNIKGCSGIGPVKASREIDKICEEAGEEILFEQVYETYRRQERTWTPSQICSHIRLTGQLLKIRTIEGEKLWDFQSFNLMRELDALFTQPKQEEHIRSTEHTTPETENGSPQLGTPRVNTSQDVLAD